MADETKDAVPTGSYLNNIVLRGMPDPNSGFYTLMCSKDNGKTLVPEYTSDGKIYHQRDINRIAKIPFEHIKMKSPNGTAFYLSVSDDGQPVFTKVGDSQ